MSLAFCQEKNENFTQFYTSQNLDPDPDPIRQGALLEKY
jgi:hypothetical protein